MCSVIFRSCALLGHTRFIAEAIFPRLACLFLCWNFSSRLLSFILIFTSSSFLLV